MARKTRILKKALPLALVAGVAYLVLKPKLARASARTRPASPAGRVPNSVEIQSRLPTSPAKAVPTQLTPAGRSADIVARIRAGVPVNG